MDHQKDPHLTPGEDLKARSNLLKLKLQLEHGMQVEDTSALSPEVENQWLESVYAFEQQYKDAKRVSVYDYIGRPPYSPCATLSAAGISKELKRLHSLMAANAVQLDCLCEYDDAVIYRFITEEFFQHEMDDMRLPGMVYHFTYEEFHPNHDYDLRREANNFVEGVFARQWHEDYHGIMLARTTRFSGKEHDRAGVSGIITSFQEAHGKLCVEKFDIMELTIDTGVTTANVRATLSVSGKRSGQPIRYEGECAFHFVHDDNYWYIESFALPGLLPKD